MKAVSRQGKQQKVPVTTDDRFWALSYKAVEISSKQTPSPSLNNITEGETKVKELATGEKRNTKALSRSGKSIISLSTGLKLQSKTRPKATWITAPILKSKWINLMRGKSSAFMLNWAVLPKEVLLGKTGPWLSERQTRMQRASSGSTAYQLAIMKPAIPVHQLLGEPPLILILSYLIHKSWKIWINFFGLRVYSILSTHCLSLLSLHLSFAPF